MNMEEKTKIWNFAGVPYKLSVFYKASPVTINSERIQKLTPVTSVDIRVVGGRQNIQEE